MLSLTSPVPYAVYQRRLARVEEPKADYVADPGPLPGRTVVRFAGSATPNMAVSLRIMTANLPRELVVPELGLRTDSKGRFNCHIALPAGGWYLANLRQGGKEISVAPFGIGEVYLVAGQSYAGNYHSGRLTVTDPHARVTAFSPRRKQWRVAHDPQPTLDFPEDGERYWAHVNRMHSLFHLHQRFDGGSVWPLVGDMLVGVLGVPVGFANLSFGGSSIEKWHPDEKLFEYMSDVARNLGRFRAVLWAQGEKDVQDGMTPEEWTRRLKRLQRALADRLDFTPDWLVAKSTRHPTVYDMPDEEAALRKAVDRLWRKDETIFPGADTDRLIGDNRAGLGESAHFSIEGQRRAAWLWFHAVMSHIEHREALAAA